MVRSCIPSFPDLSFLFYSRNTPAPLSPLKPRAGDLTAIPYASWQPPTCPQKCERLCPHLPVGVETRVNGQMVVPAAAPPNASTPMTEEVSECANIDIVAEPTNNAGKVGEASTRPAGASLLTIAAVPAVSEVHVVDGERTPDLTSLLEDDGSEPDQHVERAVKKRSGVSKQITADWLATLPSLLDADLEPDDNASVLTLYDIDLDDDEVAPQAERDTNTPALEPLLTADATAFALFVPSIAIDEPAHANVDRDDAVDELDPQPADERYLRPLTVPAAEDIDVWCSIAASPSVVADVSNTPDGQVDKQDTEGKPARPLSHVFFFSD